MKNFFIKRTIKNYCLSFIFS